MEIKRLHNGIVTPASLDAFLNNNNGATHMNLTHGAKGVGGWKWFAGVDKSTVTDESALLTKNDYVLIPVYKAGKHIKDKAGNLCYNISRNSDPVHTSDLLVLWTPASKSYTDVKCTVLGGCEIIGSGKYPIGRGGRRSLPAPVVEIYADATLRWVGTNPEGVVSQQLISYDYGRREWTTGDVLPVSKE